VRSKIYLLGALTATLFHAGCDAAQGVEVEPLPPLERPSAEARAGLPEIEGVWRFAGREVATAELGDERENAAVPGAIAIQTQRLDSLGGYFGRGEVATPFVGEVRRDGIVSVVFYGGEAAAADVAAGRLQRDTLWIELSTRPGWEVTPPAERWAYVRGTVGQTFLRLPTGELLRDTVPPPAPADTLPPAEAAVEPGAPAPTAPATPAPPAEARPQQPQRQTPQAQPQPQRQQQPAAPRAQPDAARPPAAGEQPRRDTAPRQPAQRDTARPLPPPGPTVDIPPER
jgi:hypothetical protein